MQLDTLSKVKGWISLGSLILSLAIAATLDAKAPNLGAVFVCGLAGWLFIIFGIGWIRTRSKIRTLDYQARAFQKRGY